MALPDAVSEGRFIGYTTSSTTVQILPGRIVEFDSSGDIVIPTTTPIVDQIAGVTASKVAARTTATKENILVQVTGVAHVLCTANEGFTIGRLVRAGVLGIATTAVAQTTITATALAACIGKVVTPDATTEGTTVAIRLTL